MNKAPRDSDLTAPIYPAYCHRLSPTNSGEIWCPLVAADIHEFRAEAGYEGQNIYFYLNHPFKFVQVIATVTDVHVKHDARGTTITLHLDDSSAASITAELKLPAPAAPGGAPDPTTTTPPPPPRLAAHDFPELDLDSPDRNIGRLVKIKGVLERHWLGRLQIGLRRYGLVADPNEEVRFWEKAGQFRRKWRAPWVLSEGEVRECREERERAERAVEERALGRRRGPSRREV